MRLMRMMSFYCVLGLFFFFLWQIGSISKRSTQVSEKVEVEMSDEVLTGIDGLNQTDKRLWVYVRTHHITFPSLLEYNFGNRANLDTLIGIHEKEVDDVLYPLFNKMKGGFFVEVGAYDGIASHTLRFERELGWNGLLIECSPTLVPVLKSVNRKAYIADVCLSTLNRPTKMKINVPDKLTASGTLGNEPRYLPPNMKFTRFEVQTIPLYSILASINVKEVDLFIFDIQGMELEVLKNFPFELILVKVWVIEVFFYSGEQRNWLKRFMASKGYPEDQFKDLKSRWSDFMFIHKSFQ